MRNKQMQATTHFQNLKFFKKCTCLAETVRESSDWPLLIQALVAAKTLGDKRATPTTLIGGGHTEFQLLLQ